MHYAIVYRSCCSQSQTISKTFSPYGRFIFDILVGIWLVKLAATELSVHLRAMNTTPEAKTHNADSQTHTHNTLTTFQRM